MRINVALNWELIMFFTARSTHIEIEIHRLGKRYWGMGNRCFTKQNCISTSKVFVCIGAGKKTSISKTTRRSDTLRYYLGCGGDAAYKISRNLRIIAFMFQNERLGECLLYNVYFSLPMITILKEFNVLDCF